MTCSEVVVGRCIRAGLGVCNRILANFFLVGVRWFHWSISVFLLGFVVICNRSTGPPGGNQVDGLPPALSRYDGPLWTEKISRFV